MKKEEQIEFLNQAKNRDKMNSYEMRINKLERQLANAAEGRIAAETATRKYKQIILEQKEMLGNADLHEVAYQKARRNKEVAFLEHKVAALEKELARLKLESMNKFIDTNIIAEGDDNANSN